MSQPVRPAAPHPQAAALLEQLERHLESELALQKQLLAVAEAKTRELTRSDARALQAVLERERPLLDESARLQQLRDRLLRALVVAHGLQPGEERLTVLAARAPEALRGRLLSRQRELRQVVESLREANDSNQFLLQQGLGLMREVLAGVFGGAVVPVGAYDRRGLSSEQTLGRGRLVDIKG